MKNALIIVLTLWSSFIFAQDNDAKKQALLAEKKANAFVYKGNSLIDEDDFVSAEMAYREALSKQPTSVAGVYNLGHSYIKKGSFDEAIYRLEEAAKTATSKSEKHKAFHNIGNVLMQNKKCKEAVEAYKNALRNDPTDEETRYNLGLAKICAEQQKDDQDQNKDENKDNKNQDNKDNQDQKDKDKQGDDNKDENKDNKDQGDQDKEDKKEGDDKKDEDGKPKDEKDNKGKGDKEDKEQP